MFSECRNRLVYGQLHMGHRAFRSKIYEFLFDFRKCRRQCVDIAKGTYTYTIILLGNTHQTHATVFQSCVDIFNGNSATRTTYLTLNGESKMQCALRLTGNWKIEVEWRRVRLGKLALGDVRIACAAQLSLGYRHD